MYQPQTYAFTLVLMLVSMICWGSWANAMKATKGFAFQLFYWDYVIGVLFGSLVWGFTAGSAAGGPSAFLSNISHADTRHIVLGLIAGAVFNVANILLVAAIDIAGMAVAFPVGIGLALVIGSVSNYLILPKGSPLLLFGGVALVLIAILLDASAYRMRESGNRKLSRRGLWLSIASGLLMGLFYPLVVEASTGKSSLGPYSIAFIFAVGVALCSLPLNSLLMRKPIAGGDPVPWSDYFRVRFSWHLWGVIGGAIWCTGAVTNFVASNVSLVGPAVSYSIGQGATMVSAIWGVFVWREFSGAPPLAQKLLALMFLCFIAGLVAVACAPLL